MSTKRSTATVLGVVAAVLLVVFFGMPAAFAAKAKKSSKSDDQKDSTPPAAESAAKTASKEADTSPPAPELPVDGGADLTLEQGHTDLPESFSWEKRRERIRGQRREALAETKPSVQIRTMYLDRNKFDDTESAAWAIGGSAGFKTGYFRDLLSVGLTGYTSQKLYGPGDKDGTLLLKPGQESYSVLGEIYGDILITDDIHVYAGRKGFDTPYINRNDVRMTPNTFEAAVLSGRAELGDNGSAIKYGAGYFNRIKERNSDDFVPMSEDAGATVDRGVSTAGALYQNGDFSVGAIDYYSDDIINIVYTEAKHAIPLNEELKLKLSAQYSDQQSTGDDLLTGEDFSSDQFGLKAEMPVRNATFTAAYTVTGDGDNMQNPWSGYPGYTSVQVQDFNRSGEDALLLRMGYSFSAIKGLSAYGLWVNGSDPEDAGQFRQDEYDMNLQWAASEGLLKGLMMRVRYAVVDQHGGDVDNLEDFRVICSYDVPWN